MTNNQKTLRLIYPQWQGGVITSWFPNLRDEDASKGYYLGARLLNFLSPNNNQETVKVPISLNYDEESSNECVSRKNAILNQTKAALEILNHRNPDRILTLGGECSVSVVPFTFLASKYPNDVAVVWFDAHPDINLPGDEYTGYHAMAVTACIGLGQSEIVETLPASIDPSKILIAGLCSYDKDAEIRLPNIGINTRSPHELKENPKYVIDWLATTKASKVLIHFDLDVLDPMELLAAVDRESGKMKIQEVLEIIKNISANYDVVGLTISEYLPDVAIKIKNILSELPLIK